MPNTGSNAAQPGNTVDLSKVNIATSTAARPARPTDCRSHGRATCLGTGITASMAPQSNSQARVGNEKKANSGRRSM
ncbi:hypothetical protein D3C78_1465670 [compost metagenome]